MEIRALRYAGTDWVLQICEAFVGLVGRDFLQRAYSEGVCGIFVARALHQIAVYLRVPVCGVTAYHHSRRPSFRLHEARLGQNLDQQDSHGVNC